jgi:hypothetical protein
MQARGFSPCGFAIGLLNQTTLHPSLRQITLSYDLLQKKPAFAAMCAQP